jgi:site-specific DNA-methyltransferase (adenine-specific)
MNQAPFLLQGHNPDVLSCISNLSNDEVFTPPELANQMLDSLESAWAESSNGENIWESPNVTFLDPCTKSGVYLREIVRRLNEGLASQITDLTERINHILTTQVYGIAITELTSLLARRTLYCSKSASSVHSIARTFTKPSGNIWYERTEHEWSGHRCTFCGASRSEYEREIELETYAYAFLHTTDIQDFIATSYGDKNMKFDVVIGNPPYQLNDGGGSGSSASPIYHKFIEQAQNLEPRFLTMVIPSKWYSGGKGLDEFRSQMLTDRRIRYIADFPDSREAFAGVDVAGGVCYFLWNRDDEGICKVETFDKGKSFSAERRLDEFETFIRDNRALQIVHKVLAAKDDSFASLVSSRKPFGIESAQVNNPRGDLYLFASGKDGKIKTSAVPKGHELIETWRVLLSKTSSEHAGQTDKSGTKRLFSRIEIMPPGSVCTESYLVIGPFKNKTQANNATDYLRTRFVRFLVSTILLTQNISKSMFEFVPSQDFSKSFTDQDLYVKYDLSAEDIAFIEASIRVMEPTDA